MIFSLTYLFSTSSPSQAVNPAPIVMWVTAISNSLIALAYLSIAAAMLYLLVRRRPLAPPWISVLFGLFFLASGASYVFYVLRLWLPVDAPQAVIAALTAGISLATAFLIWPVLPRAAQVAAANADLQRQIARREQAEAGLREANAELERRVAARTTELSARTAELLQANRSLQEEIEERRRAEVALRQSEAHFRALYSDMAEGVALHEVLHDEAGRAINYRILDVNAQYERIVGIPREQAVGKLATALYGTPEPPYLTEFCTVGDTGQPYHFETYFPPMDKHFYISVSNTGPGRFATIFFDISERKRVEAAVQLERDQAQRYLDVAGVLLVVLDSQGCVQILNKKGCEILGYQADELLGRSWFELCVPPDARPEVSRAFAEIIAGQIAGAEYYESEVVTKSGALRLLAFHNVTLRDAGGKIVGTLSSGEDITQRRRATLERERLMRELEAKNKELETIVYVASHDLRSPLVNVQGFGKRLEKACAELAELLGQPGTPPDLARAANPILNERIPKSLGFINASAEKMDTLLGGLLRLSRIGRAALRPMRLDMNQMFVNILAAMSFQAQSAGATIVVDPLPASWGDPVQINQVFTNLLDNALKYRSPDRPLRIHVSGEVQDRQVIYTVADTGLGIASEHQDRIWDLFHRLDPTGPVPGEGLGLTLVRRIVDRQNGRTWVESTLGQGSRFFVALPAERPEA